MIYTIEKRTVSNGNGTVSSHYEVRSYTRRSSIGILMDGKTLKRGTKQQCDKYCFDRGYTPQEV